MTQTCTIKIIGTPLSEIEIAPTDTLREIAQCVKTIITTWRGTVFLDRNFGIDTRLIDQPTNTSMADLTMDITAQIERYEPRVDVVSVEFQSSDIGDGEVIPLVTIKPKDDVLL